MHSSETLWCKVIPHMSPKMCMRGHIAPRDARTVSTSSGLVCAHKIGVNDCTHPCSQTGPYHTDTVSTPLMFQTYSAGLLPALARDIEGPGAMCCQLGSHGLTAAEFKVAISSRQGGIFRESNIEEFSLWHILRQCLNILGTSRWDVKPTLLDRVNAVEIIHLCKQPHSVWVYGANELDSLLQCKWPHSLLLNNISETCILYNPLKFTPVIHYSCHI